MKFVALVPAVVSILVLAAHFLRMGALVPVVLIIVVIPLLGLRRWWVPRLFQLILVLGALEWLRTMWVLRDTRVAQDEPFARTVAVLAGVALFTIVSAALFELPRVRRWYRERVAD